MIQFFGKYRGTVSDNKDPLMLGRVKASVPDVLGDSDSGWAMPCFPFGGSGMGFYAVPDVGAGVWIEFEHGDPDYPIWSGCWYGVATDLPQSVIAPPPAYVKIVLMSKGGSSILIDDTPGIGGITIKTSGGQTLEMTMDGITLDNGMGATVELSGTMVRINDDALEVM